jgi:hypothetical protein
MWDASRPAHSEREGNGLYGYRPTPIDDDVREEYWTAVRGEPGRIDDRLT